jgi:predicted RNA-binding Zn-ribbon protein involved in translation (DUF1610 family)
MLHRGYSVGFKEQFLSLNQRTVAYRLLFVYWAQMPARCALYKPEPITFDCPNCGAKYIIVTAHVANSVQHSRFACAKCDALFPAGEGQVSLEYMLLDGDANE